MKLYFFLVILILHFLGDSPNDQVSTAYRSEGIEGLMFKELHGEFFFVDDYGEQTMVEALVDGEGLLYWHRRIKTPVCQTGECKAVYVGLYWYPSGAFLGLDVYDEPLTKTDHSIFREEDYLRLVSVLSSDRSILGEYEYDDLLGTASSDVDGITGATREDIAAVAVKDAVYTTFTLWHLLHDGEGTQLRNLTAELLNSNRIILERFIHSDDTRFHALVLELLEQEKLKSNPFVDEFVVQSMRKNIDPYLKNLAFRALSIIDFSNTSVQKVLARNYLGYTDQERVQILTAMPSEVSLEEALLEALILGAIDGGEWMAATTLETLRDDPTDDPRLKVLAKQLSDSEKSFLRSPAQAYLRIREKTD